MPWRVIMSWGRHFQALAIYAWSGTYGVLPNAGRRVADKRKCTNAVFFNFHLLPVFCGDTSSLLAWCSASSRDDAPITPAMIYFDSFSSSSVACCSMPRIHPAGQAYRLCAVEAGGVDIKSLSLCLHLQNTLYTAKPLGCKVWIICLTCLILWVCTSVCCFVQWIILQ